MGTHVAYGAPSQDPLAGVEELGRYIGATRTAQQIVYRMLDYCANEIPDKHEQIKRAREQWDSRNLAMVRSTKDVANAWLVAKGIPQDAIPELLAVIEPSMDIANEATRPDEKAVATLAAKTPEERKKTCGFYTGFVIGGGQDIRLFFPKAIEFYEKYAPRNP